VCVCVCVSFAYVKSVKGGVVVVVESERRGALVGNIPSTSSSPRDELGVFLILDVLLVPSGLAGV
jgi:hypothetical protein